MKAERMVSQVLGRNGSQRSGAEVVSPKSVLVFHCKVQWGRDLEDNIWISLGRKRERMGGEQKKLEEMLRPTDS